MPQTQTLGFENQPIPTSYREQIPRLRRFGLGDSEAQASDYLKQPRGSLTSHSVLEQVKSTIETLSRNHLFQLRQVINKKLKSYGKIPENISTSRLIATYTPKDRSIENEWLRLNREQYAGQWVALDGNQLIAHGKKLKEVADSVQKSGVADALFVQVESKDSFPWAGF